MNYDICPYEIDMTKDVWSFTKDTEGINGVFLKTRRKVNGAQLFFKLSSYDMMHGFYGVESVMEIIAQRVAAWENIPCVEQRLVQVKISHDGKEHSPYAICSKDYRSDGDRRISLEQYCIMKGYSEDWTEQLLQSEFGTALRKMMLLDYIIYNRDRHGANIEVLYSVKSNSYRLVSAFDNGCSLIAPSILTWKEKDSSYYLSDAPVNNYLGSMFLSSNLKDYCVGHIKMKHTSLPNDIMLGLDNILGSELCNFLFEMLKARYENAMDILNT